MLTSSEEQKLRALAEKSIAFVDDELYSHRSLTSPAYRDAVERLRDELDKTRKKPISRVVAAKPKPTFKPKDADKGFAPAVVHQMPINY